MSSAAPRKKARTIAYSDPKFSDLTLEYGDQTRKVHKVILCNKSGWFGTALTSSFMEADSDTIELPDDDPKVLDAMVDFCYEGKLDAICMKYGPTEWPATFCVRLFQVADKYDIPTLRTDLESWFTTSTFASCSKADQEAALGLIYRTPHAAIARLKLSALKDLRKQLGDMTTRDTFQDLIAEYPLLAVDILKLRGKRIVGSLCEVWKCERCREKVVLVRLAKTGPVSAKQDPKYCPTCRSRLVDRDNVKGYPEKFCLL